MGIFEVYIPAYISDKHRISMVGSRFNSSASTSVMRTEEKLSPPQRPPLEFRRRTAGANPSNPAISRAPTYRFTEIDIIISREA
jgi:hypothetical protein